MSSSRNDQGELSRRSLLSVAGTALGATAFGAAAANAASVIGARPGRFVRPLGAPDLWCPSPGLQWGDCEQGPISVTLAVSGQRPVRVSARLAATYGGPENSYFGVSFAEDGVDMQRDDQRGLAVLHLQGSTVAAGILEPWTVRQVTPGTHTWTLRFRHEQPLTDDAAQRSYVRTHRMAPLEFTVEEA